MVYFLGLNDDVFFVGLRVACLGVWMTLFGV